LEEISYIRTACAGILNRQLTVSEEDSLFL
jgi:hypothetical protein